MTTKVDRRMIDQEPMRLTGGYATRAAFVADTEFVPDIGAVVSDGRVLYVFDDEETSITDLPGWKPFGWVQPYHYGAVGDGVADDRAAFVLASNYSFANNSGLWIEGIFGITERALIKAVMIDGPGTIKLLSDFASTDGVAIRLGSDVGASGHADITLRVNGGNVHGTPTAVWDASGGTFPSGSTAGNCYIVGGAGTVGGVAFATGDRLYALVSSASTSVYAGNWEKRAEIIAVQITDSASPYTNYRIYGLDCDIVCDVYDNTERARIEVSGYNCILVLRERSGVSPDTGSPDNNTYIVRGSSCVQWFKSEGTCVSQVIFDTQAQKTGFTVTPVRIESNRTKIISGICRTSQYGGIRITPADGALSTCDVIFDNFHVEFPGGTRPWLIVDHCQQITGHITARSPDLGAQILHCGGANLQMDVYAQVDGTILQLGSTSGGTNATRAKIRLHYMGDGAPTAGIDAQAAVQCRIEYTGVPYSVTHTAGAYTAYRLPALAVANNVAVTLTATATVEFDGQVTNAQARAFTSRALGMRAYQSDGTDLPIYYTGAGATDGWQKPSMTDL